MEPLPSAVRDDAGSAVGGIEKWHGHLARDDQTSSDPPRDRCHNSMGSTPASGAVIRALADDILGKKGANRSPAVAGLWSGKAQGDRASARFQTDNTGGTPVPPAQAFAFAIVC